MNSGEYGTPASEKNYFNYDIKVNGGVAYCAEDDTHWVYSSTSEKPFEKHIYVSASKFCDYGNGCFCSTSGDPRNGYPCDE